MENKNQNKIQYRTAFDYFVDTTDEQLISSILSNCIGFKKICNQIALNVQLENEFIWKNNQKNNIIN